MKNATNRRLEAFLLVTFPLALFVGCAGDGGAKPGTVNVGQAEAQPAIIAAEQTQEQAKPYVPHLLIDMPKKETETEQVAMQNASSFEDPQETKVIDAAVNDSTTNNDIHQDTFHKDTLQVSWLNKSQQTSPVSSGDDIADAGDGKILEVTFTQIKQPEMNIINFASGDTDIDMSYLISLQQHAKFLTKHPGLLLTVSGHTDSVGSEQANMKLSEERAQNVYNILLSYGAPEAQLVVDAFGESSPLNEESNYQENRRVELEYSDEVILSSR